MSAEETKQHPRNDNPVTVRIHHGEGRVTEKHFDGKVTHVVTDRVTTAKPIGNPKEG